MERSREIAAFDGEILESPDQNGYTLIEIIGVAVIMVIIVLATQGMTRNYKRYAIEETAVQRLKQLSQVQTMFRYSNDPALNQDGTYGTFLDLQNSGLIPELYEKDDVKRRTVNAFVPNYQLNFMRSLQENTLEPDKYNYIIEAVPLTNSLNLKTFYVQEDGEVYWQRFIYIKPR